MPKSNVCFGTLSTQLTPQKSIILPVCDKMKFMHNSRKDYFGMVRSM